MRRFLTKTWKVIAVVAGFCIILIGFIWIRLTNQLALDKKKIIDATIQRNSNLAVALEQYAIRTLQNANANMQVIKKEYEKNGSAIDLKRLLEEHKTEKNFFLGVAVVDEKGNMISANYPLPGGTIVNIEDRDHFKYQINHMSEDLFVGKPIISRSLGRAVIPLSVRLNKKDGHFGGIVSVQIEPSTFTSFYAEANLRPNDIISLVSPDGITYSRRTGSVESYGEDISQSPLYEHLKKQAVGNYFAKDAIRGVPTYFSYRRLGDYPMIATVGVAKNDVLAEYNQREARDHLGAAIITLLVLLFLLFISLALIQRKRNVDRLKESEVKYRSVFENSQDAILLMSPDGQMLAVNNAACSIFKMKKEDICLKKLSALADLSDQNFTRLIEEGNTSGTSKGELRFLRGDGSGFIGEATCAYHNDADGNERCTMIIRDITERRKIADLLEAEQKRYQRRITKEVIVAQEREREVIGRELHDNVNQVLTTIKLYLEMAMNNPADREKLIPKSIHHLVESINEIRNLSRDLSAPTLGTRSLIDSLTALLEMVRSSSGLYILFQHQLYYRPTPKDQKLAIYRIVQEQLNNVIKHANATEVLVCIAQTEDNTQVIIKDNGRGFDPSESRTGIGLNNIISRAKVFDGEVKIESGPDKGCSVTIDFPAVLEKEDLS
jgi:PAS domain S-box-containing protein